MLTQGSQANTPPNWKPTKSMVHAPTLMIPVFKSPILLYRLGLGWLFGHRFMLLTHVGRRSGKVRRTILAVLRFDRETKEIMAISAWSASEWYKNIQAAPALEVEMASVRYVPAYRALTPEEIADLFDEYRRRHPLFTRVICQIPGWKWNSTHDEFVELARTLRGIAFRPRH